ncbi:putative porin [Flavivirga jejuensis]|uniref:Porin n=1 Tax=Flavivirga jejuensis TaxID=870487 RepID=A0ABT8WML6_9FLAO|nr:putative porin [Flavivirga jejuensis]MDO5974404.1 putative porin [Flavivirga jejuensis]
MEFHKFKLLTIFIIFSLNPILAQEKEKTTNKPVVFGDFRFRGEQDWDSRKSNGDFRKDRSRLRYRFRLGVKYDYKDWAQVGARIRTGNILDQQGPHITLGGGDSKEFGLVNLGFEKLYFKAEYKYLSGWIGKNSFPFFKQNELFWNDNVFVEGIAVSFSNFSEKKFLKNMTLNLGHFIFESKNSGLDKDRFLQGIQLVKKFKNLSAYTGIYYLNHVPDIPDGMGTFDIEYNILNLGALYQFGIGNTYRLGVDYYQNLSDNPQIEKTIKDENTGLVGNIGFGKLKQEKDWSFDITYAYLEKISVVDYFAQNDWARWDYASFEASGSRLTNFQGVEFKIGYMLNKQMNLIFRGYRVHQIKTLGQEKETGSRVRIDFNFKF